MARGGAHKHLALENRSAGSAAAVDAVIAFVVVLMRAQLSLLSLSFAPSHPRSFAVAVVATPTRTAAATATATPAATAFHFRHVANFVFMQQISISCYKIARFALVLVDQRACVCVCVFLALCQFATSFSFFSLPGSASSPLLPLSSQIDVEGQRVSENCIIFACVSVFGLSNLVTSQFQGVFGQSGKQKVWQTQISKTSGMRSSVYKRSNMHRHVQAIQNIIF